MNISIGVYKQKKCSFLRKDIFIDDEKRKKIEIKYNNTRRRIFAYINLVIFHRRMTEGESLIICARSLCIAVFISINVFWQPC